MYQAGDRVIIVENSIPTIEMYHSFKIGKEVIVKNAYDDGWLDLIDPKNSDYVQCILADHVIPKGFHTNSQAAPLLDGEY